MISGPDLSEDDFILKRVRAKDPNFAKKLEKNFGGSLGKAIGSVSIDLVHKWLEKFSIIREIDPK